MEIDLTYEEIYKFMTREVKVIIGNSKHEVDDVVQSAMEQFLISKDSYRGGSPKGFVRSIARNMTKRYVRDMNTMRKYITLSGVGNLSHFKALKQKEPDMIQVGKQKMQHLFSLVDGISKKNRRAFELFYFEHKTVQDISKQLGASIGTVKAKLFHARRELYGKALKDELLKDYVKNPEKYATKQSYAQYREATS